MEKKQIFRNPRNHCRFQQIPLKIRIRNQWLQRRINPKYSGSRARPYQEAVFTVQVTYWVVTEELPAACKWIFPVIGIVVLQFDISATDKQEVKIGLIHYLLTKIFPKGARGNYEIVGQFVITVSDEYYSESAFMGPLPQEDQVRSQEARGKSYERHQFFR